MALELKWTRRSKNSFDHTLQYLEERFGENVSVVFIRKTFAIIEILKEFPQIGTIEVEEKEIRGFLIA